jgi:hypothetical protein
VDYVDLQEPSLESVPGVHGLRRDVRGPELTSNQPLPEPGNIGGKVRLKAREVDTGQVAPDGLEEGAGKVVVPVYERHFLEKGSGPFQELRVRRRPSFLPEYGSGEKDGCHQREES